ncbi:MAG TPA: PAS domain S-box protein [Burkholderiales bacterium]|nr:PAS domain S-box protein [Burkholderiales bacterium]
MNRAIHWIASRIRNSTVLPWTMLGAGIAASLLLWFMVRENIESAAEERFAHQATEAKQIIERRVLSYAEVLFGAKALFATGDHVTRLQFHDFVGSLDLRTRFPGFDSLNYTAYVRADDKRKFVESVRRDTSLDPKGYPQFAIKPPGDRPEYYVLVYLEPMAGFEFAFGLDIGANPAMGADKQIMAAVQQSGRDTGKLTASGLPIHIKNGAREYVGLGMRLPVYRNGMPLDSVEQRQAAYLGSVGAGFDVERLMAGVLEEKTTRYMRFRVFGPAVDGGASSAGRERLLFDSSLLIHESAAQSPADDPRAMFTRVVPMEIAGRIWEIHFSARKDAVIDRIDRLVPSIVLLAGLFSSLLLFGVLYSLSSSRERALALAAKMTTDLRESEERFRLIAENASDLITVVDPQGRRVYANPAFGKLFGDVQAVIGIDAFQDIHPEDRERVRRSFLETVRDGRNSHSEFRILLPSGGVRDIETYRSAVLDPQGRVERVVAVSRDVTERQRTEEALRARDVQLQEAQALANLGSWEWDLRTNSRTWSDQLTRIFGLRSGQLPSSFDGFYPLVHPEDRERTAKLASEALRTGKSYENQFRIVRPDGLVRTLHNHARVDRDESGRAVRVIGVCQDVTERKLAEEQVRISQERFRMMVENVRDYAIYMLDMKGYVTSWNLGAERIEGYLADEIIGKHYSRFFLSDHATRGDPGMQLQFASLQGRYESEGWRVRKNGSQFWAHVILTPLRDETGKLRGFSEIVHDITDRKRVEEDLHNYADRLKTTSRRLVEVQESERRLLATELHDRVGQNLTALGINLSIVAGGLPVGTKPELAARLEDCSSLVEGTVDAMRDVMAELRPHALDDYGLPAALRSLATGFSRRTGIQVAFEKEGRGGDLPKPVDLAMFRIAQEALNNVAKHANARRVEIAIRRKNGSAVLSVRDNGVGFDPQRIAGPRAEAGWGLLIMRERAEAVGAQFSLKAGPNSGVQVLVEYNA